MSGSPLAERVATAMATDRESFQTAALEEAEALKDAIGDGVFDNPQAIVGLEFEFYAVDRETGELMRVPRRLLEFIGFEKELGLHNAELSTHPQPLNEFGLDAQHQEVKAQVLAAQRCVDSEGMSLVSDGMWTIPPAGETAREYLTDSVVDDGIHIATNMSDSPRYHAMANVERAERAGMRVVAPHVSLEAETVMPESLITSIQPHYQVPHAPDLPTYFRYALRIAGPLLALAVNSPFFPPDLYDEGVPPEAVIADGWMEHRISVFETMFNDPDGTMGKVRFPRDFASVEDAVDRIATDPPFVPQIVDDETGRYDDRFAHLRHKHGTYWRWVRPVFEGPTRSSANARIEFRPIPAQPTVRDVVAFQAAFVGLMENLRRVTHPVAELEWRQARENFYGAMRNGIGADLVWVTEGGSRTTIRGELYEDLFAQAWDGLTHVGIPGDVAERYLWPLRQRARHGLTPARWKRNRAIERLEEGADLENAIYGAQREYIERQRETMLEGSFVDWAPELAGRKPM